MELEKEKAQVEINKTQGQLKVVEAKNANKEPIPRYEAHQGIVKFYTPDMKISR